ncbi:MAG TPA: DNA methyltransferase [Phycisphaerales bacterium]|nr:DNA methyltransferase [Phycisphaerales bacterium]
MPTAASPRTYPALFDETPAGSYVRNGIRKRGRPPVSGNGNGVHAAPPAPKKRERKSFDFTETRMGVEARCRVLVGDCREILPGLPEVKQSKLDLVFADPPFNWNRAYDKWDDRLPEQQYLDFTFDWLDLCVKGLRPGGALWVNIPDDWAAEIVVYLKGRMERKPPSPMLMQNWCVWHYRFGQNAVERFINSKVHALYFVKCAATEASKLVSGHTWNPKEIAELSDRAAIYGDARTLTKKDGMPAKMRVPMDVWYGQYWGRIQGNNTERRHYHDNQLPEVYLERVVRACSNAGDLVLDPFLGSGTTGVMAHALGRNFIGCEFSAENAGHAVERIKAGPVRLGAGIGASTAIFGKRRSLPGKDDAAQ